MLCVLPVSIRIVTFNPLMKPFNLKVLGENLPLTASGIIENRYPLWEKSLTQYLIVLECLGQ